MKYLVTILVLVSFVYSCKKNRFKHAMVEKDCTGTYIRINFKDYKVCNVDALNCYDDGDMVNVKFEKDVLCDLEQIVCMMVHEHQVEGIITILEVE